MMTINWLTDQFPGRKRINFKGILVLTSLIIITVLFSSCQKTEKSYYPDGKIKFSLPKNESGKLDGEAKFWYQNGKPQLVAEYKDGVLDGKLCRYRENGIIETEDLYSSGKLNGLCREFHYNGNVLSEMPYINDTLEGNCRQFDDVGQIMIEGRYQDGYFEGKWVYHDRIGNLIGEADFKKGAGIKKSYDPDGNLISTAEFVNNLKHGKEIFYHKDGREIATKYFDSGDRVDHIDETIVPQ